MVNMGSFVNILSPEKLQYETQYFMKEQIGILYKTQRLGTLAISENDFPYSLPLNLVSPQ